MAVQINTSPLPYSTRAVFDASTDIAEDSSHINVRLEAQLFDGVDIVCKKTLPKILTTFDFTDVLRSFVRFTQPTPFVDPSTVAVISPSKIGNNLITSWSNKTSFEFGSFASTDNAVTMCSGDPAAHTMVIESNPISFVAGKVYVLAWKNATQSGAKPYINIASDGSMPYNGISNYIHDEIPDGGGGRFYFLSKVTLSTNLAIGIPYYLTSGSFTGEFELYEFEVHDWFKQYNIFFAEKYEDAAGVTQTVASTTDSKLYTFFKSTIDESEFNSDYVIKDATGKFLSPDGYFGAVQRSQEIMANPIGSNKSTPILMAVVDPLMIDYAVYFQSYYSIGPSSSVGAVDDKYSPIAAYPHHSGNITGSPVYIVAGLALNSAYMSEFFKLIPNYHKYPYHIEVNWINELGGISTFFFGNEYVKTRKSQKDTYKTGALISKVYNSTPIMEITAESRFLSNEEAEFLDDLITSALVMEHTTVFKEIEIQDDAMQVHNGDQLNVAKITYQYAD